MGFQRIVRKSKNVRVKWKGNLGEVPKIAFHNDWLFAPFGAGTSSEE